MSENVEVDQEEEFTPKGKLTPDYFYMDKKGNEVSEADAFAYFVIFHDEAGNPIKEAYGVISDKKEPSDEETPPEE